MKADELRALLEQELAWRLDEMRQIRNVFSAQDIDEASPLYRRTVMVMTYAHFEGFAKQALGLYADFLNRSSLKCELVVEPIAATTIASSFLEFRQPQHTGTDDPVVVEKRRLRAARRETEFVRLVQGLVSRCVQIDIDEVVSTESNLTYDVLQRIMYRLGLDQEAFSSDAARLGFLVRTRNKIAHGERSQVLPEGEFRAASERTIEVMNGLVRLLYAAVVNQAYLRPGVAG